ncbi:MAG: leucine-rich repeat domain-containing protein [Planctomycetota bacterium]
MPADVKEQLDGLRSPDAAERAESTCDPAETSRQGPDAAAGAKDDESAVAALKRLGAKLEVNDGGLVIKVRQLNTDEGMAHLGGLPNLEELHVEGVIHEFWSGTVKAAVKEHKALTQLERLPKLRELLVDGGLVIGQSGTAIFAGGPESFLWKQDLAHLKDLRQLESLHIQNVFVTDAGLRDLKGLAKLTTLSLGFENAGSIICHPIPVTDAGLVHLRGLTELKTLELDHSRITGAGLSHLKGLAKLERLSLRKSRLTDAGVGHVNGLTNLRSLDLSYTKITDVGLDRLKTLTGLRQLQLTGTNVTEEGIRKLREALKDCRIETSTLRQGPDAAVDAKDDKRAVDALKRLGATLEFDEQGQTFKAVLSGHKALTQLRRLPKLRELHVDGGLFIGQTGPFIGVGGPGSFLSMPDLAHLKDLPQLESLYIQNTFVADAGLGNLKGLPRLRTLSLGFDNAGGIICHPIRVTDAGLVHLQRLTELKTLELDHSRITGAGLSHLKGLAKLERLSLCKSRLTDAGLEHAGGLTNLRSLDLSYTKITDVGLEHLKTLTGLRQLQLTGTSVTEEGIRKLREALKDCRIDFIK